AGKQPANATLGRLGALAERLSVSTHAFLAPGAAHRDAARAIVRDGAELAALLDSLAAGNAAAGLDPALRERILDARTAYAGWQEGLAPLSTNLHNFSASHAAEQVIAR